MLCSCSCAAVGDEPGPGGAVVPGHALRSLPAHGLLPVHAVGVCHHRVQDAVPAECGQPHGVRQQLQPGKPHTHTRFFCISTTFCTGDTVAASLLAELSLIS